MKISYTSISLYVIFFLCHILSTSAKTVFVSPIGDDQSTGSYHSPFLTVQKGLDSTFAGDTLLLKEGGYFIENALELRNSGKPMAWVTIMAEAGKKVTVNAGGYLNKVPEGREGFQLATNNGSFNIKDVSYVRIEGLTIFDSHAAGIYVKNSKNIEIKNCSIMYSMSSGIGVWYSDSVTVAFCEIMEANTKEKTPKGIQFRVETPHEAISIAGCKYFDVSYNYLHNCEKEGIDVKEFSSHGSVHHNYLHDINRQALYVDSWFGMLEEVKFFSNIVHDSEWGFGISGEGKNSYMKNVYFYDNLIYDCRASGIIFSKFGVDATRENIFIINNTVYNCGIPGHWAGNVGGIDVRSASLLSIVIVNNIVFDNWGFDIAVFDSTSNLTLLEERKIVISNNLVKGYSIKETPIGFWKNKVYTIKGQLVASDPRFESAIQRDFTLSKRSSAIDKSTPAYKNVYYQKNLGADFKALKKMQAKVLYNE